MDKYTILQVIEKERLRQGMSKRELAKKAGVTDRSLYMWGIRSKRNDLDQCRQLTKSGWNEASYRERRIMLSTIIGIAIGTFVGRLIFDIWKSRKERRNRHGKEDNTESGG